MNSSWVNGFYMDYGILSWVEGFYLYFGILSWVKGFWWISVGLKLKNGDISKTAGFRDMRIRALERGLKIELFEAAPLDSPAGWQGYRGRAHWKTGLDFYTREDWNCILTNLTKPNLTSWMINLMVGALYWSLQVRLWRIGWVNDF